MTYILVLKNSHKRINCIKMKVAYYHYQTDTWEKNALQHAFPIRLKYKRIKRSMTCIFRNFDFFFNALSKLLSQLRNQNFTVEQLLCL